MKTTVIKNSNHRYYFCREKVTFYSDENGTVWFDVEQINGPLTFVENGLKTTTNLNKSAFGPTVSVTTIKDKPTLLINRNGIIMLLIYYPGDKSIQSFLDWLERF